MKKKVITGLLSIMLMFSLIGCTGKTINMNVENSNELNNTALGIDVLIKIGGGLYYDPSTRIVYWWNGSFAYTVPTPYYAPNGLPYRYNSKTNTFEEIKYIETDIF